MGRLLLFAFTINYIVMDGASSSHHPFFSALNVNMMLETASAEAVIFVDMRKRPRNHRITGLGTVATKPM